MKEYETLVASATPLAPDVFWRAIESETQKLRLPVAQRARLNPTVVSCTLSRNRNLYAGMHPQTVAIWAKQDLIPKTARGCANMAKRLELPDPAAAQAPPLFQEP